MSNRHYLITVVLVIFAFILGGVAGGSTQPSIVVNLPKDAKPMAALSALPPAARDLSGDRATLYWTIYRARTDAGASSYAADDAKKAVETVYGPIEKR